MSRIAILGNTAGGKSTLARHLAKTRCLPHIEIDEIYWLPEWTAVPSQIYEKDHDAAIEMPEWIIDGGGDLASVRKRVARATELILLDFPLWIHFWRAAERQMAWANGTLQHPPGGGQECRQRVDCSKLFGTWIANGCRSFANSVMTTKRSAKALYV